MILITTMKEKRNSR